MHNGRIIFNNVNSNCNRLKQKQTKSTSKIYCKEMVPAENPIDLTAQRAKILCNNINVIDT